MQLAKTKISGVVPNRYHSMKKRHSIIKLSQFNLIDLLSSNVISERKRQNRRSDSPKHDIEMIKEQDSDKESESSLNYTEEISKKDIDSQYKSDRKILENKLMVPTKSRKALKKNKSDMLKSSLQDYQSENNIDTKNSVRLDCRESEIKIIQKENNFEKEINKDNATINFETEEDVYDQGDDVEVF